MAIGHFNISGLVLLKAVFTAARELNLPVLVGLSEGERAFVGTRPIAAFVRSLREEFDFPIFLNADHTHSLAKGIEAARAGFDCFVFDLSALPLEENVRQTKQALETLKAINPSNAHRGRNRRHRHRIGNSRFVSRPVERALHSGTSKTVRREHRRGHPRSRRRQYARMLRSMVEGETKKHLDIARIAAIKQAAQVFLTLHGGSALIILALTSIRVR